MKIYTYVFFRLKFGLTLEIILCPTKKKKKNGFYTLIY
jgi:hypothetical protein